MKITMPEPSNSLKGIETEYSSQRKSRVLEPEPSNFLKGIETKMALEGYMESQDGPEPSNFLKGIETAESDFRQQSE